ncbi:helix-turn-helix transcriptional regulator, partial [Vibrio rotiferianus]
MPVKQSMYLAPFLRTYRTEMDWSQTKLFEASGVARRTITRAENGERVSQEILEKLSLALGLTHWTELVDNRDALTSQHAKTDIALKVGKFYLKTLWQSHVLTLIVLFYLFVTGNIADVPSSLDSVVRYCLLTSCLIVPLAN